MHRSQVEPRVNVLVLHSKYATGAASGENRVVEDEVRLLSEAGHSVRVVAPMVTSDRSSIRIGMNAIWSRSAARATADAISEHHPDVVHVHNLYPLLSPAVIRSAREAGVPVVMTIHNFRLSCLAATLLREGAICEDCVGHLPWRGVVHGCYRGSRAASAALFSSVALHRALESYEAVSRFAVVSSFILNRLASAGVDPRRAVVRPNFASAAERRIGPGEYFLYLGRLSQEKGVAPLVADWSADSPLLVAGDGPERPAIERAARGRNVKLVGVVEPKDAHALIARARAIVLPSLCYEGAPRVLVEAFASGTPVIANNLGGIPEQVDDGRSGLLVEPGDAAGWRSAACELEDDERSLALGAGALESWRARYSPEVGLASLESIYHSAIASRSSALPSPASGPFD
jgi:glycosyltransferase involved in cell wall biosynthesis